MPDLPSSSTPLYHHSLPALEQWLERLGARRDPGNPCLWGLQRERWRATIELDVEDLRVEWRQGEQRNQRLFPYGLSRADVEAAIQAGP
ncbi:DUF3143 domain-containing protein [Synechococcus sp. RSCCF101]|uniref:DUF3143 domain-containing protein n=1 Tax=Synechococcus sp. RSCCF101 TaxID=2511069 RepID=UPI0012449BD6|nr:DUF3143 domain-containing protein [Synechococcus sp. RSCCF101]QEY33100.1 DUF3143 domain-containing protein [Synechococcus sp. RSCCF101]